MNGTLRVVLALAILLGSASSLVAAQTATTSCRPLGYDRAELLELRESGFAVEEASRERFATQLLECLGDPDSVVRDQIGYEGIMQLLRSGSMAPEAVERLRRTVIRELDAPDPVGVRRPFLILALAEVARVDRVAPLYTDTARDELVSTAAAFMREIDDYRGFDEQVGWRHAVAHSADVLMQLTLNPTMTREQLIRIRDAVGTQVVPGSAHFYIYGESGRLARPILFAAQRGLITDEEWADWLGGFGSPEPFDSWNDVFSSQEGLAKLHNTKAFAQTIYINASAAGDAALDGLEAAALDLLRQLP